MTESRAGGSQRRSADLQHELDEYARRVDRLYSPIWSCLSAEKEDEGDKHAKTAAIVEAAQRDEAPVS